MRISTIIRVIEDTAVAAGNGIAQRTKSVANATRVEYQARTLARAQRRVVEQQKLWRGMSKEERAAAARDEAIIQARAAELIANRAAEEAMIKEVVDKKLKGTKKRRAESAPKAQKAAPRGRK
jgi:hypothetical protein